MSRECWYCEHCKQHGRQQTQQNRQGRKRYYCEHPQTLTMKNRGLSHNNFIGFGTMTFESPLALRTQKRWCPIKRHKQSVIIKSNISSSGGRHCYE